MKIIFLIVCLVCSFQVSAKKYAAENPFFYTKPLELKMRVKVAGTDKHQTLRFLTTPDYFKLIDEPYNVLQLRIYLRKNRFDHDAIDDVARIFVTGIRNVNNCYFDPSSCIAINISGKVSLYYSYQDKMMILKEIPQDS